MLALGFWVGRVLLFKCQPGHTRPLLSTFDGSHPLTRLIIKADSFTSDPASVTVILYLLFLQFKPRM